MSTLHKTNKVNEDPRDILFKFNYTAGPPLVNSAYKNTAPNKVFYSNENLEDEIKFYEEVKRKKCPKCGLKFCSCIADKSKFFANYQINLNLDKFNNYKK